MADKNNKERDMDTAVDREELGLGLQTTGIMVVGFCSITGLWIFTGWRVGSWFWFWVTAALLLVGSGAAAVGSLIRGNAYEAILAMATTRHTGLLKAGNEELPPSEDVGPKAA